MINNTDTITFHSATHGTFKVSAEDLDKVATGHSGWTLDALISKITYLVGIGDYSDLRQVEALILISYLTGGSVD